MAALALRSEERIGLIVAVAVHAALLVVLVLRPPAGEAILPPERIEVTLTSDVGLTSTSPEPDADAAPDIAPQIGEPLPAEPEVVPEPPRPEPARAAPEPPKPAARASPRPSPRPVPAPAPRATSRPVPKPAARPSAPVASRVTAAPAPRPSARAGGSRIGSDFLEGVQGAQGSGKSRNPPAAAMGPAVRSALSGAITRQLKPHWTAPQGPDAEELVTILAWDLNSDGSIDGIPRVVNQLGVNDINRAQAGRHAEQAIRAVQLAAPFNLPSEYYDAWKRISAFRFDKRLSQ